MKNTIYKFTLLFFITTFYTACFDKKRDSEEITVFNEFVYRQLNEKNKNTKFKIIDTGCINGKKRAYKDIEKGKLKFYADSFDYGFSEKQIIFREHNIELVNYVHPHNSYTEEFEKSCYEIELIKEVYKIYGEEFTDSLLIEAERNFAKKNPDSLFIRDGEDIRYIYLNN